jgi:hypothetical protein
MKSLILVPSLVSIALTISIASANEMTLSTDGHSTLNSANLNELPIALPLSQISASYFHLAMMDEKEDMDDKDKMKNKGDMKKMHDKDHMHKMNDKDKMKNKDGKAKKGVGKKGAAQPSGKKSAPVDGNPPSTEMSDMPAPMTEPAPMSDM